MLLDSTNETSAYYSLIALLAAEFSETAEEAANELLVKHPGIINKKVLGINLPEMIRGRKDTDWTKWFHTASLPDIEEDTVSDLYKTGDFDNSIIGVVNCEELKKKSLKGFLGLRIKNCQSVNNISCHFDVNKFTKAQQLLMIIFDDITEKSEVSLLDLNFFENCFNGRIIFISFQKQSLHFYRLRSDENLKVLAVTSTNYFAVKYFSKTNNFEYFIKILQSNDCIDYEKNQKINDDLNAYRNKMEILHNIIGTKNQESYKLCEEFLSKNSTIKLGSFQNKSAIYKALECKQFMIFSLLKLNQFCAEDGEDLDAEIVTKLSIEERKEIFDANRMLAQSHSKDYIYKLCLKSLYYGDVNREYDDIIDRAYNRLNIIPELALIMKMLAQLNYLEIWFDFSKKGTHGMDPNSDERTLGSTFSISTERDVKIIIGAELLLAKDEKSYLEGLATLAHELGHAAVHAVYRNNFKPYFENGKNIERYSKLVLEYSEICDYLHKNIADVFLYDSEKWPNELIVRVLELLVIYQQKVPNKIKTQLKKLFRYYQVVHSEFIEELPFVAIRQQVRELNVGFKQYSKVESCKVKTIKHVKELCSSGSIAYVSNCPKITIKMIHQELYAKFFSRLKFMVIFADLDSLNFENYYDIASKLVLTSRNALPILVLNCSNVPEGGNDADFSKLFKTTSEAILIAHKSSAFEQIDQYHKQKIISLEINHKWDELELSFRKQLLNNEINFLGTNISVGRLLKEGDDPTPIFPINSLVEQLNIKIFPQFPEHIKNNIAYSINRKFVTADSKNTILENVVNNSKSGTVNVLHNPSGWGKTTTALKICDVLRKKDNFVVFTELGSIIEVLNSIETLEHQSLAEYVSKQILNLKDTISINLFEYMYAQGKVSFVFDGYNEVNDQLRRSFIELLNLICSTKNNIWVTTNSLMKHELDDKLSTRSINLEPFSKKNRLQYLQNVHGINDGIIAERLSELFSEEIIGVPQFFINVVEILKDELSSINCDENISNLYQVYDMLKNKLMNRWNKCDLSARTYANLLYPPVVLFHKIALYSMDSINGLDITEDRENFVIVLSELKEALNIIGITTESETGNLKFINEAYHCFFVVDFIITNIFKNITSCESSIIDQIVKVFVEILSNEKNITMRLFLDHAINLYLEKTESWRRNQNFLSFKNSFIIQMETLVENESIGPIFHTLSSENSYHIIEFLNEWILILNQPIIRKIWGIIDKFDNNVLMNLIERQCSGDMVIYVLSYLFNNFNINELKSFFDAKNSRVHALLRICVSVNNEHLLKVILGFAEIFDKTETIKWLQQRDFRNRNSYQEAVSSCSPEIVKLLLNYETKLEIRSILSDIKSSENLFCISVVHNKSVEVFETIWKYSLKQFKINFLKKLLLQKYEYDASKISMFQLAALHSNTCIVKFIWIQMLNCKINYDLYEPISQGETIFTLAERNCSNSDVTDYLIKLAKKKKKKNANVTPEETIETEHYFQFIIETFKKQLVSKQFSERKIKCLEYVHMLCDKNILLIDQYWEDLIRNLTDKEVKTLLKIKDLNRGTILHIIVKSGCPDHLRYLINILQKCLKDDCLTFILQRDDKKRSAFYLALKYPEALKILIKFIQNHIGVPANKQKVQQFVKKDIRQIRAQIENNRFEVNDSTWNIITEFFENLFDSDDLLEIRGSLFKNDYITIAAPGEPRVHARNIRAPGQNDVFTFFILALYLFSLSSNRFLFYPPIFSVVRTKIIKEKNFMSRTNLKRKTKSSYSY